MIRKCQEHLDLERVLVCAEQIFDHDTAVRWLYTPSRYLGGGFPVDVLRTGQVERVLAALEALDSGVFV